MPAQEYSKHLGIISDDQFQSALDRFDLGKFVQAEPIPFGLFGQNVFLTSTPKLGADNLALLARQMEQIATVLEQNESN